MKYPVASLVFDEILLMLFAKGCFTFFAEKPDWNMLTVLRMLCVFEMRNDSSVFFDRFGIFRKEWKSCLSSETQRIRC